MRKSEEGSHTGGEQKPRITSSAHDGADVSRLRPRRGYGGGNVGVFHVTVLETPNVRLHIGPL